METSWIRGRLVHFIFILFSLLVLAMFLLGYRDGLFDLAVVLFSLTVPGLTILECVSSSKRFDPLEKGIVALTIGLLSLALAFYLAPVVDLSGFQDFVAVIVVPVCIALTLVLITRKTKMATGEKLPLEGLLFWLNGDKKVGNALIKVLSIVIIIVVVSYTFTVLTEDRSEKFTELYVLNSEGQAYDYPRNMAVGEPTNLIIGVANHEERRINYTIEAWLVNFTSIDNEINVTQMFFVDSFNVVLNSTEYNLNDKWKAQWETTLGLNLTVPGNFTLFIMLFDEDTQPLPEPVPDHTTDYSKTIASWRIVMCANSEIQYITLVITVN